MNVLINDVPYTLPADARLADDVAGLIAGFLIGKLGLADRAGIADFVRAARASGRDAAW